MLLKKFLSFVIVCSICLQITTAIASKNALEISAPSALLMDYTTGEIIFEKNPHEKKPMASVTKIMTMLLGMEEIKAGNLSYDDMITGSAHAKSYGGSTIFLDEGEQMTVRDIFKGIAVASGNDAAVALGEHISGTESVFVDRMNKKAEELGMTNTHFVNCCGLDVDGHITTARDIAMMSRELTTKYPDIFHYSSIWMDEFVHKTAKGESVFGLSNTNKLIKYYPGCNGLKTGSTSKAKFCLSATATRNNISLIAVVMGCPDSKSRSADVSTMFDYGFANVEVYEDTDPLGEWKKADISGGEKNSVGIHSAEKFAYTLLKTEEDKEIRKNVRILEEIKAPVKKNEIIGEIDYLIGEEVIGTIPIYASEEVKEKTYLFSIKTIWDQLRLDT